MNRDVRGLTPMMQQYVDTFVFLFSSNAHFTKDREIFH